MEDLRAQEVQLSSIIRLFSLLIGSFIYLVVVFSPTSVKIGEFLLYGPYKKLARILDWIVQ